MSIKFLIVDVRESTARDIYESRAKRESSSLNMASKLYLAMSGVVGGRVREEDRRRTKRKDQGRA